MTRIDMSNGSFGYLTVEHAPLFTDLYELRMMQAYYNHGHNPRATFSLFVRELSTDRGYLLAAGLEQVLTYIDDLSFSDDAIAYLSELDFDDDFLDYLADLSFSGDVRAVPEGTPVFPNEPILEVTAPIVEAQLLETMVINQIGYQTLSATKAARMCDAVERYGSDQSLVDFGSRRAHGTDAGIKAARAAYIAGFDATSNIFAGHTFDVPVSGTMAHSWIQSFDTEREAFETFIDEYGDDSVLLIDTYDTIEGAKLAASLIEELDTDIRGVRLDSGDLATLSREVSNILPDSNVFISSGIDEYAIRRFFKRGGIADGFGPGTSLVTSSDDPSIDAVYKLVSVEREGQMHPTMKLSTGKVTYPGEKSVNRTEADGVYTGDILGMRDEDLPGTDILETVIRDGSLVGTMPELDEIRERAVRRRRSLPEKHRDIEEPHPYDVQISERLSEQTARLGSELEG